MDPNPYVVVEYNPVGAYCKHIDTVFSVLGGV